MLKPRLRVRVLIVLMAIAAVVFGVVRWRRDRELRADLLRRAESCEHLARSLRVFPMQMPEKGRLLSFDVGEQVGKCTWTMAPGENGMTWAEAAKEFEQKAEEYDRLASAYRRAVESPWARSSPPIPAYVYRPATGVTPTRSLGAERVRAPLPR